MKNYRLTPRSWLPLVCILVFVLLPGITTARTVVKFEFGTLPGGNPQDGDTYVELFDGLTPLTVQNFLNYVNRGDYDGNFIHRVPENVSAVPEVFAVQAGGYLFDPANGSFSNGGTDHIPVDDPVVNEFSKLTPPVNVRGTLAMAKAANPDSARSEWFFNIIDNSESLDDPANSGGFTTFGKVLENGMDVLDAIAATPTFGVGVFLEGGLSNIFFDDLPLIDFPPSPVEEDNLLFTNRISRVLEVNPDKPDYNFGLVATGSSDTMDIVVTNLQAGAFTITSLTTTGLTGSDFSIISENCATVTLSTGNSCTITAQFSPTTADDTPPFDTAPFDLNFSGLGFSTMTVTLQGRGADPAPKIEVTPAVSAGLGTIVIGLGTSGPISVQNIGTADLSFTGPFDISGPDAGEFSVDPGLSDPDGPPECDSVTTTLTLAETCQITISFIPTSAGAKIATLTIPSNDPASPSYTVTLNGFGTTDQPNIDADRSVVVGDAFFALDTSGNFVGTAVAEPITITNTGALPLHITGGDINGGAHDDDFRTGTTINCPLNLAPGDSCTATVRFTPSDFGTRTGVLRIFSDDLDEPTFLITLTGTGSHDVDGIPDTEEDAGPLSGDANGDRIPDRLQGNVVTYKNLSGDYITLWNLFADFSIFAVDPIENPSPEDTPAGLTFNQGFHAFRILALVPGTNQVLPQRIAMILHSGFEPTTYYMFGRTPDNRTPHWYEFKFDGTTGAEFEQNVVFLNFVDGERGDNDLLVNGIIRDPGGPAAPLSSGGSSGGGGCTLTGNPVAWQARTDWLVMLLGLAMLGWWRHRRQPLPPQQR